MNLHVPPAPTCINWPSSEVRTLVSSVMALLDIARLEVDQDHAIAKASIVRVCALLRVAIDPQTPENQSYP
jgi:hypothetical protein